MRKRRPHIVAIILLYTAIAAGWGRLQIPAGSAAPEGADPAPAKAKVAIVIDDFGQTNREGVQECMTICRPLTFGVMPNLEYSYKDAVEAARRGFQVIVHLPMQPVRGRPTWLGPGAITREMSPEEIRRTASRDFTRVPFAIGFNNHMGSVITSREDLIRPVLEAAKDRGFFVLDSRTCEGSKIPTMARALGIPYIERDVFLDNVKDVAYIKKQLDILGRKALAEGYAVGIGHVGMGGKVTARAIKEMIPIMASKGIKFVYLSELVHQVETCRS